MVCTTACPSWSFLHNKETAEGLGNAGLGGWRVTSHCLSNVAFLATPDPPVVPHRSGIMCDSLLTLWRVEGAFYNNYTYIGHLCEVGFGLWDHLFLCWAT